MSANIIIGKRKILNSKSESEENNKLFSHFSLDFNAFIVISLRKTAMFLIRANQFLFVGLFACGNAETQTFSVSWNWDGFELAES